MKPTSYREIDMPRGIFIDAKMIKKMEGINEKSKYLKIYVNNNTYTIHESKKNVAIWDSIEIGEEFLLKKTMREPNADDKVYGILTPKKKTIIIEEKDLFKEKYVAVANEDTNINEGLDPQIFIDKTNQ